MRSNEEQIFDEYIRSTGLRETEQRKRVLKTFLATTEHVSVEDMYRIVNEKSRKVGYATVYRTMKLIAESGLAVEVVFNDGIARFEHRLGRKHHHHLVCTNCGKVIEFESTAMDRGEQEVLAKYKFRQTSHHYEIFGFCRECQSESRDG
ncbi:MAG: transcriptional repressor [FCB group bacterium]|nr:transcriptional repressor [FCB group bacterium]